MNYYNEHDPKAAAWIQELINQKLIPEGYVDTRSITEVIPADLTPYTQCHFFAGIGGWSYALQLAGVQPTTRLWTGSCPCQPFSTAGKGLAQADERHLWPVFFDLIRECRPQRVFGEQVASAIGHGWLDGISADLEAEGYACGAAVLGAHSVKSPHQRQRLYWVAHHHHQGSQGHGRLGEESIQEGRQGAQRHSSESGAVSRLVLPNSDGCSAGSPATTPAGHRDTIDPAGSRIIRMADSECGGRGQSGELGKLPEILERRTDEWVPIESTSTWSESRLVRCRDGKTRRIPSSQSIEPILQRMVNGIPCILDHRRAVLDAVLGFPLSEGILGRTHLLKGYGNAIVPQVAAEFIRAFYEIKYAY